jgi:two-component system response regulator FixJ
MTTHTPIVYIVHDDPATCSHIRHIIEAAGLEVEIHTGAQRFLEEALLNQPGCVVVGTHAASGVQRALAQRGAQLPVVVVTDNGDVSSAVSALKAGALDVVEGVVLGDRIVPAVLRALAADLRLRSSRLEQEDVRLRYTQLSPRECEVLKFVVEGQTSSAIARQLGIREKTVEIYRSHINKKMRVRNAVQLARIMQSMV